MRGYSGFLAPLLATAALAALAAPVALPSADTEPPGTVVVTYEYGAALRAAFRRYPARLVRSLPQIRSAVVQPNDPAEFAARASSLPGIESVAPPVGRYPSAEPALTAMYSPGVPYEWQYTATHSQRVAEAVLRAAASVTIAVVDTGADLTAPDLAAKRPATKNILNGGTDVRDTYGHGTFVASIAGGSIVNGEGIAGFGGDAKLMIVQAGRPNGSFTDVEEAAGILYAVDHGAKVINLSIGGTETSAIERRALRYAAEHGVLVVGAAGNEYEEGNPVEYPAAVLQPIGSNGRAGWGLSVGATRKGGKRAYFSNTGSWLSLAAPGDAVFGAISSSTGPRDWPRHRLPGSKHGLYGYSGGTSFSAPQVAGAAALVWAANPTLSRQQVIWILKHTASGRGRWNSSLGYGILNVARAVAMASAGGRIPPTLHIEAVLKLLKAHTTSTRHLPPQE